MKATTTPKNRGFTLIEIVVVLVLISIIAAAVFTRSIGTNRINFVGQVDKIRNQIRYAQSRAMKENAIWGIKCFANQYWLFKDSSANAIALPGEKADKISLADLGVSMNAFSVYFDELGVPYKFYPFQKVSNGNPLNITISISSESRILNVTPETGFIKTQ